jgi:hypothetical protein
VYSSYNRGRLRFTRRFLPHAVAINQSTSSSWGTREKPDGAKSFSESLIRIFETTNFPWVTVCAKTGVLAATNILACVGALASERGRSFEQESRRGAIEAKHTRIARVRVRCRSKGERRRSREHYIFRSSEDCHAQRRWRIAQHY